MSRENVEVVQREARPRRLLAMYGGGSLALRAALRPVAWPPAMSRRGGASMPIVSTSGPRRRLALVALVASGMALSAPAVTHGATNGDCRVDAQPPLAPKVYPESRGRRISLARATVTCATPHHVKVELWLVGEDPASDDYLDAVGTQFAYPRPGSTGAAVVLTLPRWSYLDNPDNCNEDWGGDELYSWARIRLRVEGPEYWSPWSAWDRSRTVTYSC
jgi:hypothetical protein